jgi:hypothetical protein
MLRRGAWSILTAIVGLLLAAAQVSADTAPQPAVSGGVTPLSASAGTSAQPNSGASVSDGRATTKVGGGGAEGMSCGAQAGAAGNRYGAQPTKVGTAGTSNASGCVSGNSGATAQATGSAANGKLTGQTSASKSGQAPGALSTLALDGVANGVDAARNGIWFWLALALLIGILLFLLGVAVAPRRRHGSTTA